MNAPLALSLKALSTLSNPAFVLIAALAQMFAPPALSLPANNRSKNQKLNSETAHPLPAAKAVFCVPTETCNNLGSPDYKRPTKIPEGAKAMAGVLLSLLLPPPGAYRIPFGLTQGAARFARLPWAVSFCPSGARLERLTLSANSCQDCGNTCRSIAAIPIFSIAYTYIYLNGFRQSQPSFQREQP